MLTSILFVAGTLFACAWHLRRHARAEHRSRETLATNEKAGLNEPVSLHPVIDNDLCIGCGACVEACPEGGVLALVLGKAALVEASRCIGHGACKTACPTGSIQLVFGTDTRGVEIPHVGPNFETNVPGVFIAGELGGMGLIGNAVEQGRRAIDAIRTLPGIGRGERLDVVIVGAGPAGFSATLAAKKHALRALTIEQDTLGGTIAHFPRGKIVMTRPVELPIVGRVKMVETTKEKLVAFWRKIERDTGLSIRYKERLERIAPDGDGFAIRTSQGSYRSRAVLLAIGRRGTPRKLDVPGEELEKVVYRLIDPEQYRGKRVLVVGGGDSALEAAAAIAAQDGTTATLSYRGRAFDRAKEKNRKAVELAAAERRLTILQPSIVLAVHNTSVELDFDGQVIHVPNEAVIVCAGGTLSTPFLRELGIAVETKRGTA